MRQDRGFRFRLYAATIIVIGGLLIFLHYLSVLRPIENVVVSALQPVQRFFYNLTQWSFLRNDPVSNVSEDDLNNLLIENTHLRTRVEELKSLVDLQNFSESNRYKTIPARVVSMSPDRAAKVMIIDQGRKAGVENGDAVISGNGALIGRIFQVSDEQAQVLLIIDNSSTIAARIQNDVSSPGVVFGEKGLSLRLDFVPQNEEILPGQMVVTSGLEDTVPRGLIIGQIDAILSDSSDLFQSASLRSMVKFDRLSVVGVIK